MITAQAGFEASEWRDLAGVSIPMAEAGALAAVCRDGSPLLFAGDTPLPEKYRLRAPYSELAGVRVKSFLVIPMIARGRTVGVLAADNRVSRAPIPTAHRGPAPYLRRAGRRRRRERSPVPGDPGQGSGAGAGESAQVPVPRQHEPRAAHADERRARLHRPDPGRHLRRRAPADPRDARAREEQRPAPPRPDQRRARFVEDGGGAAHPVDRPVRHERRRPRGSLGAGVARRGEEPRLQGHHPARPADGARRRAPAQPGADQPGRQRHQVHRQRAGHDRGQRVGRRLRHLRVGHRPRHLRGRSAEDLRGVPAGRQLQYQGKGGHRARAHDLEADRGAPRRTPLGDIDTGRGVHLLFHGAAQVERRAEPT